MRELFAIDGDLAWQNQAACRGTASVDSPFFPDEGRSDLVREARKICAGCPVKWDCYAYGQALKVEAGIWGGGTWRQLARIRRRPQKFKPALCSKCGEFYVGTIGSPNRRCQACGPRVDQ